MSQESRFVARHDWSFTFRYAIGCAVVIVCLVVLFMTSYFAMREAEQVRSDMQEKVEVMREGMRVVTG